MVLAHVYEPAKNNGISYLTVYNWINMFHMPLFIFISGRFSAMKDRKRYLKGMLRILETYIIFQILWRGGQLIKGGDFSIIDWLTPYYMMWYILSLVFWRLMIYVQSDMINERLSIWIFVSVLISLMAGFIPVGTTLSLQRTLAFLPFFIAGYCTRQIDIISHIRRIPFVLAFVLLVFAFIILIPIGERVKMTDIFCCAISYPTWKYLIARVLFIISATCMGIAFMRIVPTYIKFAQWGKHTLLIYIYHAFGTYMLFILFPKGILPSEHPWLLIYCCLMLTVLLFLSRFDFFHWLLNPISRIMVKYYGKDVS